jgi:hypothetical protein
VQAEEGDLAEIPQIAEQASAVLNAARAESLRRPPTEGEAPATV